MARGDRPFARGLKGPYGSGKSPLTAMGTKAPKMRSMTALEYALAVLNDPTASPAHRDRMCAIAMPYCHPRASAIGRKEQRAEAARLASLGKHAPREPPSLLKFQPRRPPPRLLENPLEGKA